MEVAGGEAGSRSIEFWTAAVALKAVALALLYRWARRGPASDPSSSAVDERKLLAWTPRPLVDNPGEGARRDDRAPPIDARLAASADFGATDFLRLSCERAAVAALRKYGVGSCGPRGFYGTIDVHLELEERLARFMRVEESCVYSYGFSTTASAIPAYAKRGDLVYADERLGFAAQKGLDAAKCEVVRYRHNDLDHLEGLLRARRRPGAPERRSFLVAEGIYFNTGELCPLDRLVALRRKYRLRLILDDSLAIGVLGDEGRGSVEHFGVDASEVDLIVCSLEHSFNSIGGFCAGSHFIVEHQRLSGLGYCFSASLPPLLSQAAIASLDRIEKEPARMKTLRENSMKLQSALSELRGFRLGGHPLSPIKHLYVDDDSSSFERKERLLKAIAAHCLENGTAVAVAAYLREAEYSLPEPSMRIASNALLDDDQIEKLTTSLKEGYEKYEGVS